MKKVKKIEQNLPKSVEEAVVKPATSRYRTYIFRGYFFVVTAGFVILAILASRIAYFPIDVKITRFIQHINLPFFGNLMGYVSDIGYHPISTILGVLIVGILLLLRLYWEAIVAFIAVTGSNFIVQLIKGRVNRPRPAQALVNVVKKLTDPSFPSGHVLTYVVIFGYLWFLAFSLLKKSPLRTTLLIVLALPVLLIGPSRIYLGAHWASDTFGAYLLGSILLLLLAQLYRWGKKKFFK